MKKKRNQKLNENNFNEDNTYSLFLPSTLKRNKTNNANDLTNEKLNIILKNKPNKKDENNLSKNYSLYSAIKKSFFRITKNRSVQ